MASRAFSGIDGKTALLLAPLGSSTASLVFGWNQHLFLSLLAASPQGEATLPGYWRALFPWGVTHVVVLLGATASATATVVWRHGGLLRRKGAMGWYAAAGLLALGHFAFVPAVAGRIRDILNGDAELDHAEDEGKFTAKKEKKQDVVQLQREWLRINLIRTLTTDLGAWLCAFTAAVKTLS